MLIYPASNAFLWNWVTEKIFNALVEIFSLRVLLVLVFFCQATCLTSRPNLKLPHVDFRDARATDSLCEKVTLHCYFLHSCFPALTGRWWLLCRKVIFLWPSWLMSATLHVSFEALMEEFLVCLRYYTDQISARQVFIRKEQGWEEHDFHREETTAGGCGEGLGNQPKPCSKVSGASGSSLPRSKRCLVRWGAW